MKTLSQILSTEQIMLNRKPALKIRVQQFGYPAVSSKLRYSNYDWNLVHQNDSDEGVICCCTYDGTLLMTCARMAETSTPVVRFENPTPDTDYSAWATALNAAEVTTLPEPHTYYPLTGYDMIASPVKGEVLIISLALRDYATGAIVPDMSYPNVIVDESTVPTTIWVVRYKESQDNGVTWTGWNVLNAYQDILVPDFWASK